jgi:hypothetical protein
MVLDELVIGHSTLVQLGVLMPEISRRPLASCLVLGDARSLLRRLSATYVRIGQLALL